VLELTVNESKETQLNEEVCDSYVAPDGQNLTTTGEYTYVFQAENGCDSTVYLDLIVFPTPEVSFTATPEEGYAVQDVEFINNSSNVNTNLWDFGDGTTSENNNETVNHTYVDPGEYVVTLQGINGICSDEFETTIVILMPEVTFEVPNVFTPNNDQVNDEFKLIHIVGEENIAAFNISIVNRWGNSIKEFNQYDFLWDGTNSSGMKCTEGVYFYKITLNRKDQQEFTYNGFVHLVTE
jgi:gliding motility-associated-like protein